MLKVFMLNFWCLNVIVLFTSSFLNNVPYRVVGNSDYLWNLFIGLIIWDRQEFDNTVDDK